MSGESHTTTDHATIRDWAEARDGWPAHVKDTEAGPDDAGILRIAFDPDEQSLERLSWDDFFEKFEESQLAFLYQEETSEGETSRFFKLISRD
jgi:hypothetical protein